MQDSINFCAFLLSRPFVLNPDTLTIINYAIFNQTFRLLWSYPTTRQLRSKLKAYFRDRVVGICYILLESTQNSYLMMYEVFFLTVLETLMMLSN